MIEVYKYLHGQYNVEEVPLLLDEIRMTRGYSRRLKKERVERNHFRHRTVNRWNSLTEEVVSAPSLNSFKSRLDELWRGYIYVQNYCFPVRTHRSRVAQGAYLEVEYIRNVLSVSGTLKYADSGTA